MTNAAPLSPLEALRSQLSGCEIAVLTDLQSQTCLLSASVLEVGQERFDDLCQDAREMLGHGSGFPETLGIRSSLAGHKMFLRLGPRSGEALCLVFAPSASLSGVEARCLSYLQDALRESSDAG